MEFAISQKWSDYHETYSKHIGWTLGLKCDHQPWPWSWIFKVKYGICYMYISTKSGPVAMKRKANISIEPQASNMTNAFDLGHDLNFWIFKVKCDLNLWPHTWPWPRIFMVKIWNSCISEWVGWLTLNKGGGSKSFMTMSLTIWWPRSGVRSDSDLDDFRCGHAVDTSCTFIVNRVSLFQVSPAQIWVASWICELSGHQLDEPIWASLVASNSNK